MEYVTLRCPGSDARIQASRFGAPGGVEEVHLTVQPGAGRAFDESLADLAAAYRHALALLELPPASAVFRRVFLSDAANQAHRIVDWSRGAAGLEGGPVALSLVEQAPLPEGKVGLWAYHVKDPAGLAKEATRHGVLLRRPGMGHLWTAGLSAPCRSAGGEGTDAGLQTADVFGAYGRELEDAGASLADHALRTWLFVQNVDVNYGAMVRSRAQVFARHGMTADTHYVASTGIEGRHADPGRVVLMDAYAVPGCAPGQVRWLTAPDHLGPTHLYGVTFERGVAVEHRDRCHALLSGTASIEPSGRTVHCGDIARQVERTFRNVEALLADAGAEAADLAHLIVYLRDPADRTIVQAFLARRYPGVPAVLVRAPVCRPDWLVEAECIAIRPNANPDLPAF